MWLKKLNWPHMDVFYTASREALYVPGSSKGTKSTGAFRKRHKNLAMYYIMSAGHMVSGLIRQFTPSRPFMPCSSPPPPPPPSHPSSPLYTGAVSAAAAALRAAMRYCSAGSVGSAGSGDFDVEEHPWLVSRDGRSIDSPLSLITRAPSFPSRLGSIIRQHNISASISLCSSALLAAGRR